jgi:hypothetical protein
MLLSVDLEIFSPASLNFFGVIHRNYSPGYMNSGILWGLPDLSTQAKMLVPSANRTPVSARLS